MNLLVLWLLGWLRREQRKPLRLLLGAGLGAFGALLDLALADWPAAVRFLILHGITGMAMVRLSFPYRGAKRLFLLTGELYLTALFTGGVLSFLYYRGNVGYYLHNWSGKTAYGGATFGFLLVGAAALLLLLPFLRRALGGQREKGAYLYPVEISFEGRRVSGTGFLDTGNHLRDPCSGEPVLIGEWSFLKPVFTPGQAAWLSACGLSGVPQASSQAEEYLPIRLIPFHSMGEENGILTAVRVDWVKTGRAGGERIYKNAMVACYRGYLSGDRTYQIILHSDFT